MTQSGDTTLDDASELPFLDAMGRPTLRTVAELASVHTSTVSRALSPHQAGVRVASAATLARVREVADRIGFERNPSAANLRLKKTNTIGVLVPRLSDLVLANIYEGIERQANAHGVLTMVTNTHDRDDDRGIKADMLLKRRVDGLILGDARFVDDALLASLHGRGIPFVLVSRRSATYPSVTCDDAAGGALVARHLIENGHRELAVIAGQDYASTGLDRTAGFLRAANDMGVAVREDRVIRSGFDTQAGHAAAVELLGSPNPPTAIFAVNDFAAIGAMGAIRDAGLTAGLDIAVVGYNDVSLARELPIALSSVESPHEEMGARSVELLLALMAGGEVESELLEPVLTVRESSVHRLVRQ